MSLKINHNNYVNIKCHFFPFLHAPVWHDNIQLAATVYTRCYGPIVQSQRRLQYVKTGGLRRWTVWSNEHLGLFSLWRFSPTEFELTLLSWYIKAKIQWLCRHWTPCPKHDSCIHNQLSPWRVGVAGQEGWAQAWPGIFWCCFLHLI